MARIILADDHAIFRRGIAVVIRGQSNWIIVGEASDGQEAVALVMELKPDLIVLDLSMPVMNGLQAAAKIRQVAPATKIVLFTMHDSPQLAQEAKRAGADAYFVETLPRRGYRFIAPCGRDVESSPRRCQPVCRSGIAPEFR
jgi:DNA-binding NarL/FixJ family response regulator